MCLGDGAGHATVTRLIGTGKGRVTREKGDIITPGWMA